MVQLNIYQPHTERCDAKLNLLQLDNGKYYFRVCVRIFNRWKKAWERLL